jgi:deoxyadenosine/deoxycytidine kinase
VTSRARSGFTSRSCRIEIAGGIASGKTTLARLLGATGTAHAYHERFRENPFFEAFYDNPVENAFETEITFLLQHYHIHKGAIKSSHPYCVDFSAVLDHAYACVTLDRRDRTLFEGILRRTEKTLARRGLLVVLECDAEVQLARIRRRRRLAESDISLDYLRKLNRSLASRVRYLPQSERILRVNSAVVNFARNAHAAGNVVRTIQSMLSK